MTQEQAKTELRMLSGSTQAKITGENNYEAIERELDIWDCHIDDLPEAIEACETWQDVVKTVKAYDRYCMSK